MHHLLSEMSFIFSIVWGDRKREIHLTMPVKCHQLGEKGRTLRFRLCQGIESTQIKATSPSTGGLKDLTPPKKNLSATSQCYQNNNVTPKWQATTYIGHLGCRTSQEKVIIHVMLFGLLCSRWRFHYILCSRSRQELDNGPVCLANSVDAHPQVPKV